MTSNDIATGPLEKGPRMRSGAGHDCLVEWKNIVTEFGHDLLVATLKYSYTDSRGRSRKATLVLGKLIGECVDDPFSRFVFWLAADLKIQRIPTDDKTRRAIRAELAQTVKPVTERQVKEMNVRVNALPDYLRAFYLEDYFDSFNRKALKRR